MWDVVYIATGAPSKHNLPAQVSLCICPVWSVFPVHVNTLCRLQNLFILNAESLATPVAPAALKLRRCLE